MASPQSRSGDALLWVLVAAGIALRCWQFAGNASLSIDEIALARNLVERGYLGLLQPLDYGQAAPPGFLLLERLVWSWFHTDWSLRVIPFASGLASLFLFRALARRTLEGFAVPLAVGAFAVGFPLILYGAQAKQYSSDVAVAIGLLLLAVRLIGGPPANRREYGFAGLAGFLAVWFSNSAVFVVAGLGAALLLLNLRGEPPGRRLILLTLVPWAAGAIAAILFGRHAIAPSTMAYFKEFWLEGFAPLPTTGYQLSWPWRALEEVFGNRGLRYRLPSLYIVLALLGLLVLFRRRRALALLLAGPVAMALAAAVLQQYPFTDRMVLFLSPSFLIAMAVGATESARWLKTHSPVVAQGFLLLVLAIPLERIVRSHPVYRTQESRPLFEWVAARSRLDDPMFVWYRAGPHFGWYAPRYGLTNRGTVAGGCWVTTPRRFLEDLDRVRGRARVWLIVAGLAAPEAQLLLRYADSIGVQQEGLRIAGSVPGFGPMAAWLYDLSDPKRLLQASAADFEVPPASRRKASAMACTVGPLSARALP